MTLFGDVVGTLGGKAELKKGDQAGHGGPLAFLVEDQGLVPGAHMMANSYVLLVLGGSNALFWHLRALHAYRTHVHACRHIK